MGLLVDKVEETHSIDLAWLRRRGYLRVGAFGVLTWSCRGVQTGSVGYRVDALGLRLSYKTKRAEGQDWQQVDELIPFAETRCHLGGRRKWLQCPGCARRCRTVFGGSVFRCRLCHGLRYESQYEPPFARAASRSHKLRQRLGQVAGLDEFFPPKPKGMHWRTYRRLEMKDEDLQAVWSAGIIARFKICGGGA